MNYDEMKRLEVEELHSRALKLYAEASDLMADALATQTKCQTALAFWFSGLLLYIVTLFFFLGACR